MFDMNVLLFFYNDPFRSDAYGESGSWLFSAQHSGRGESGAEW